MTMDYSPWSEREIWSFLKVANISETRMATPIKVGVHAQYIDLYCMDFLSRFQLVKFFDGQKGKFDCF